ncbi:MAG TPA: DUF5694 domain-containing protein [Pseudoduganella sp.]|jgi:hypothetical protein
MLQKVTSLVVAVLLCAGNAGARQPMASFDPGALKGPEKRPANDVMVLGTLHLRDLPSTFQPASLAALKERLIAWNPRIIAIEERSGPQCAFMRQYPQRYRDTVQAFCRWDPAPARATTGLDVPAATLEIDRLLAAWPVAPAPAERRRLAAVFLAGGEPVSALVQWLRLPEVERQPGDGLDATLVAALDKLRDRRDEAALVAAPVAAALGLERVVAMDDQTASAPDVDPKAYGVAITKAWDNPATTKRKQMSSAFESRLGNPAGVLALYRALNDPSQAALIHASDFGAALEEPSPQQFGRGYVGYWETRNLRMAANIREAVTSLPGNRTLVIVGVSHKWYLEAYLDRMHDVRIVPSGQVLRQEPGGADQKLSRSLAE